MSELSEHAKTTIVVVGDWVVDEYWFLVDHDSDTSSHIGREHFRLSNPSDSRIRELCGAGHVARVLYELGGRSGKYDLIGLGNWDKGDKALLLQLFDRSYDVARPNFTFRLESRDDQEPANIQLFPLNTRRGTTRVIRLYRDGEVSKEQLSRIDWEQPVEPVSGTEGEEEKEIDLPDFEHHEHVVLVVYDLGKGAVNRAGVKALRERFPDAPWYVRSKLAKPDKPDKPEWLSEIQDRIQLMVIGPDVVAAQEPVGGLLVQRQISREALEILRNCKGSTVILSDRRQFLARLGGDDDPWIVAGEAARSEKPIAQVGWSSAVYGSLVHSMYKNEKISREDFPIALKEADRVCESWSSERWPDNPSRSDQGDRLLWCNDKTLWEKERAEWTQAMNSSLMGIIADEPPRLDVWRASTDLPGYIACIEEKRELIKKIGRSLRDYKNNSGHNLRNLGILLRSDPGAGKTSMVRAYAKAFDFSFQACDLTQFGSRDDLLDFFDSIATEQAKGKDVLAFVDEINVSLSDGLAYGAFLTPLEEGTYRRRGQIFTLRPCVWIFAGTKGETMPPDPATKREDFYARLTIQADLDYASLEREGTKSRGTEQVKSEARLEQVYLGASMIKHFHPSVTQVSREVLFRFYALSPSASPAREIRKRAVSLRNIQYGQVTSKNWPGWEGPEDRKKEDSLPGPSSAKELVKLQFA